MLYHSTQKIVKPDQSFYPGEHLGRIYPNAFARLDRNLVSIVEFSH